MVNLLKVGTKMKHKAWSKILKCCHGFKIFISSHGNALVSFFSSSQEWFFYPSLGHFCRELVINGSSLFCPDDEGITSNSRIGATIPAAAENHTQPSSGGGGGGEETTKKEKSVLQAKLTKLAIQIGYAGKRNFFLLSLNS